MTNSKPLVALPLLLLIVGCGPTRIEKERQRINAKGTLRASDDGPRDEVPNWFTKSPVLDGVEGTQADRAYAQLNLRTDGAPVVVAVIDGGVDTTHEDLQGNLWVNEKEIPGNGIDDDQNGYVDDIHGWNFLGTVKNGQNLNIGPATLESTREVVRLKKLKATREAEGKTLSAEEQTLFDKVSTENAQARAEMQRLKEDRTATKTRFEADYPTLKEALGNKELGEVTLDDLRAIQSADANVLKIRDALVEYAIEKKFTTMARVISALDYAQGQLEYYLNESFDPRADILGDDVTDFSNPHYGNPDVAGDDASHGTHVAGIIGAVRNNGKGIDGVATNVRIMALRVVPNGDEYDKDIVHGVRYAVDNGARIINMSFGKGYSPYKPEVDKAFQYAADHNVLIIHSAGNESLNTDVTPTFPNSNLASNPSERIPGWIGVGASAAKLDLDLVADFSNYGKQSVEIFAPGVDILSTVPYPTDQGHYDSYSGTSMAGPVTAGVAALVLSQRPELTAVQLRELLMTSARTHIGFQVHLPTEMQSPIPELTFFESLSVTGGIVDAFLALSTALGV